MRPRTERLERNKLPAHLSSANTDSQGIVDSESMDRGQAERLAFRFLD
jgi:hypothetical protein